MSEELKKTDIKKDCSKGMPDCSGHPVSHFFMPV